MAETTTTTTPATGQQPAEQQPSIETFDAYLAAHADLKPLYEAHTAGLKSALDGERAARKDAEKSLRDLAKQAEAGSAAQKALTEQADRMGAMEKQNSFFDKAHSAGVRNLKLAYQAANLSGLLSDKGDCDFSKLKSEYPELFIAVAPGNAGSGTGGRQPFNMNDAIRQKAGRQ